MIKKFPLSNFRLLFFISTLFAFSNTFSANWYVNDNSTSGDVYSTAIGNDANNGTSPSTPKLTLNAAFAAAASGDVIYVDKGTFTGAGNRALTLNKAITIIGAGTGNTIFTSHTDHRFASITANNISIQNLQLFDFFLAGTTGIGQVILVNTNITGFELTNIVVKNNYGDSSNGESIYLSSGSSATFNGLFFSCSGFNGSSGGAVKVDGANLLLKNSVFSQSRNSDGFGGAIQILGTNPNVTIDKTTFIGNSAKAGGAISQVKGVLVVTNSCFNRNYCQGDSSGNTNGGGHYYSTGTITSASFTNCKFEGAFFCASTNPNEYPCQFSSNISNDGNAISIRGAAGNFTFDTCDFTNSNQPNANFDNGLDFYLDKSGTINVAITNCKFANDMWGGTGTGGSDAVNIWNEDLTSTEFVVTNSGTKQTTANQDGTFGNNYSYSGTAPSGDNLAQTSSTNVSCISGFVGCTVSVNCSTETNAPIIISCAPDQSLSSCAGVLPDYRPLLSVFDDCSVTIVQSPEPGTLLSSLGNGTHIITFTVSDQSPNSLDATCTMTLTLSGCNSCSATLSYSNTSVCKSAGTQTPTFSPSGGTFSSTTGLTIDTSTGIITPSTSTAGTYSVTYMPNSADPTCLATFSISIVAVPVQPTLACYQTATFNTTTCSWDVTGTQPVQPTLACYQTATFNTTTCSWDIAGTQPAQPTLACYQTATFNTTTCSWDVTGIQPAQPTLACYQTATFNTTTCSWDITGTQPVQPTLACYQTATFNTTTCLWDVTGTQPAQPTLACYQTAMFNTTTCSWDVTGTQPAQPTLACYQTATFNTTTCSWDVTGTQPSQPTLACYETATFNTTTCSWDVTGTQPSQPTLACYQTATFNTTTCSWDVTGTQPSQPTLACYESATFNTTTCSWDVTGTQPAQPTLACYESATFNTTTCSWDVIGTQPAQPTLACYESATFNTTTCSWDVTGTQPSQPTLACYQTATFNTTTCSWDVTGTQPSQPTLACYQTATFNTTTCSWDVTGTQPSQPAATNCWDNYQFNTALCTWVNNGTQPSQPTLSCYQTATFNTTTCSWDVTGTQPSQPTLACYQTATFNTTTCSWDVTGTQPAQPTLACYESATFNASTCSWDVTGTQPSQPAATNCWDNYQFNTALCTWVNNGTQPSQPTLSCYQTATFNTTTCSWDVTGTQPAQPTLACYQTATFNTTTCSWDVTGTQPAQPTLACYQTATFNTSTCEWDVTGTQQPSPLITVNNAVCNGSTYSVEFNSNGTIVASSGTINGNTVSGIAVGTDLTLTATSSNGCAVTTLSIISPTNCVTPRGCVNPILSAGQGSCSGSGTYSFAYNVSQNADVYTSAGIISGNTVINIPIGTSVVLTAIDGLCSTSIQINSPSDCSTPCGSPIASFSAGICNGDTYSVSISNPNNATISASVGTVTPTAIIGIPTGTSVIITASLSGCSSQQFTILSPIKIAPMLIVNNPICNGSTYSVIYSSNGSVDISVGSLGSESITDIPIGTNLIITASSLNGCASTTMTVNSPSNCSNPTDCVLPSLSAGQGTCSGNGTYSFSFNASTESVVTVSSGTISGNNVIGVALGTDVTLIATSGSCISTLVVNSPSDCTTPCATPTASFSAGICNGNTYSVSISNPNNATITTSAGTITASAITGIPVGTSITVTASISGCTPQIITISSPTIPVTPYAGIDGSLEICEGITPSTSQLFGALGGNPQIGGFWSNSGNIYTYTVLAASSCASLPFDRSIVTVSTININDFEIVGHCNNSRYQLTINPVQPDAVYSWFNGSGDLLGTGSSMYIDASDTYEVKSSKSICSKIKSIYLENIHCIIPKGVSPNGDGLNDTWDLSNMNVEKAQIFNRYGMEMYSKSNYIDEWHGQTNDGQILPSATYYYVLRFLDGTTKTGWVYLNREQ